VSLDDLIAELEDTAIRLRAGDLEPQAAAELVERCAELATRVSTELDRLGREAEREDPDDGQEQLL
jgi:hypothetical protein